MFTTTKGQTMERHDFTKPGMSEQTRRAIEYLTDTQAFTSRVSRSNARINRCRDTRGMGGPVWSKSHPIVSTSKKALEYYREDSSSFGFIFYDHACPSEVNDARMTLGKLGVRWL